MLCQLCLKTHIGFLCEKPSLLIKSDQTLSVHEVISEICGYESCRKVFPAAYNIRFRASFSQSCSDLFESLIEVRLYPELIRNGRIPVSDNAEKRFPRYVVVSLCLEHEQKVCYLAVTAAPLARRGYYNISPVRV